MLSPHISSAFVEERHARYRHEAEVARLARGRRRSVRRAVPSARTTTSPSVAASATLATP